METSIGNGRPSGVGNLARSGWMRIHKLFAKTEEVSEYCTEHQAECEGITFSPAVLIQLFVRRE
jgi:hypothetical protein